MNFPKFSILITTKNRLEDLKITLEKIRDLLNREDVECIIYDDASTDGTYHFLKENYPKIQLLRNEISKGLIHNRNELLNRCKGIYAISLDDDADFLSENPLEIIENYFNNNQNCGLISCRIFWSKNIPESINHNQISHRVRDFVGCGHIWKMESWRKIPNYPAWFVFYGEEEFASYHLFQKEIEIHYVPDILVHHRVDIKARKKDKDYVKRTRRSLRSGWYLYLMFYPIKEIPKKILYSIYAQLKLKTLKGDWKATFGILQAILDVFLNFPKIYKSSNRLTSNELNKYKQIKSNTLYWNP